MFSQTQRVLAAYELIVSDSLEAITNPTELNTRGQSLGILDQALEAHLLIIGITAKKATPSKSDVVESQDEVLQVILGHIERIKSS